MRDYLAKKKIIKARKSGGYSRLLKRYRTKWQLCRNGNSDSERVIQTSENFLPQSPVEVEVISDGEELPEYCSSEDHSTSEMPNLQSLLGDLRTWSTEFHITQAALKSLVGLLNSNLNLNLPKDARTVMNTPRNLTIVEMEGNGRYWHQGVENCLRKALGQIDQPLSLSLNFNIDGLPIHKSSLKNFWPILCNIHELPHIPPMAVGIYYGSSKPKNVTEYLNPFIDELLPILEKGLVINGFDVAVQIRCFVCDSPARSFIKGVMNFNGKHGCLKCTTKGKYCHTAGTVVFPQTDAEPRTNEGFRNKEYPEHQQSDTPLTRLPIDMVKDIIVADSLHILELGIMRKLLNGWRTGSMTKRAKWSTLQKAEISNLLVTIRFPKEIHRRMRSLEHVSLWKGLEYRNFLNYVSLVLLEEYLPEKYYQHFLLLFCAVRICSVEMYKSFLPIARDLFQDFVQGYKELYGIEYLTSNVHNLCHVVDEVERFGPLSTISAYPFENYLHSIKKMVRAGPLPLNQIANRLTEVENDILMRTKVISQDPKRIIKSVEKSDTKVTVRFTDFILSTNFEDKWILTKDLKVVCLQNTSINNNEWKIHGRSLLHTYEVYSKPFNLSFLHIFAGRDEKANYSIEQVYDSNCILCKLVAIPRKAEIVFVPLIHTLK